MFSLPPPPPPHPPPPRSDRNKRSDAIRSSWPRRRTKGKGAGLGGGFVKEMATHGFSAFTWASALALTVRRSARPGLCATSERQLPLLRHQCFAADSTRSAAKPGSKAETGARRLGKGVAREHFRTDMAAQPSAAPAPTGRCGPPPNGQAATDVGRWRGRRAAGPIRPMGHPNGPGRFARSVAAHAFPRLNGLRLATRVRGQAGPGFVEMGETKSPAPSSATLTDDLLHGGLGVMNPCSIGERLCPGTFQRNTGDRPAG